MNKKKSVEIVLEKRFGTKNPKEVDVLMEVNTFIPVDSENDENIIGIGVQLLLMKNEKEKIKEEYQVNKDGIVFSWGNTPVIDERSLKQKIQ